MTVKVYIIESESGWGQRVDEVKEFATELVHGCPKVTDK